MESLMESCNHSESCKYNICNNNIYYLLIPSLYKGIVTVTVLFVKLIYVNYIQCIICLILHSKKCRVKKQPKLS